MVNQTKLVDSEAITVNSDHVSPGIANLKHGDHVCYLYETEEEHKAVLGLFLRQGLERDEKVLYIVDAHAAETVLQYLQDDGVVLEPYLDSGQLSILTSNDVYLRDGIFSPGGMISLLRSETKRALAEGYQALRVTGEMTWVLQELSGSERLNEYEAKLNGFFPGSKCLAICQYDRRRFPPDVVLNALRTHPIIIMGTKVYDNFYYTQHTEFPNQNIADKALHHRLKHLEAHGQTKEALTISEDRYRELADSLPQTVFETDERGKLVFVNRHFFDSNGFTPEDFRNGLDALQLLHPDDRNKARENMKRVLSGEHLISNKYKALRKDGGTFPIVSYSIPIIHEHETIGARGITIDITEFNRIEHALNERVKELECLYRMTNLAEKPGVTLGELYQEAVNILPPSWQYPEVACARITINGMEFRTDNYKDTAWKQSAGIKVYGDRAGTVEVNYLEVRPETDEGPFLKEERQLINAFAQRLGTITESKQAEAALQKSEKRYRTLFNNMLNGYAYCKILVDENNQPVDFAYIEVNDAFENLTGLRKEDVLGKKVTEAIPSIKEAHPELFNIYGKVALTGEPNNFEFYFEPLEIWLAISVYSPQKGYFVAIFENITKRKLIEEKWRQYHLRLEEMVADRTAELTSTNEQFQQEIKERKRAEQALRKLCRKEENLRSELIKANGRLRKEITERRRTAKELRLLLTMTQAISESQDFQAALQITIRKVCKATGWDYGEAWVPSHDGKILEWSHVWYSSANSLENFRQLSKEFSFPLNTGLPGRVWSSREPEWLPDVSAEPEGVFLRASIALEAGLKAGYGVPIIANGQVLAVLVFFMMAYRKEDKHMMEFVSGVATQLGSVIQRKRAEQTLRELYRREENLRSELEKQICQRIEFNRVLVHELKTPLTPVLGASRMLADNLKEEPWLSLAVNINRGAHNLTSRIDELLDLAKGEIGILKLDYEWVDPSKLLQDVLDYVSPEAEILGQILISDIPPSLPQAWVDQERLRQVILNLLNNAFKFNPKGGKVTVKVRQRKGNLIVKIKDTGRGINEQEQERIFQPYVRLESDRDHLSGLGLGLSLSKMLIDLHGGRIWVKSQKGKGSTFGFSVPVKVTGCA